MIYKLYSGSILATMGKKTISDFWQIVIETTNTRSLNETERRNTLKGLELLWKSGYYGSET